MGLHVDNDIGWSSSDLRSDDHLFITQKTIVPSSA